MVGSSVIDVAIGMVLVYVFLGVICSAVSEAIANLCKWRAKTLKLGIQRLLADEDLTKNLYKNPLINGLAKDDAEAPSYIPPRIFALALLDEFSKGAPKSPPGPHPRIQMRTSRSSARVGRRTRRWLSSEVS